MNKFILGSVLGLLIICIYGRTINFDFVYDDHETIEQNEIIKSLKNISLFFFDRESTSPHTHLKYEIFRPLKTLSAALDYYFYGLNPKGFHITNLVLHFMAVLLFFYLLKFLGFTEFLSFFLSAIAAIHPALSHNIAYISGRADIISMIFILLSMILHFKTKPRHSEISQAIELLGASVCFIFACFAKENAIMLPFMISIVLYVLKKNQIQSLPYWIISIAYFIFRYFITEEFAQCDFFGGTFLNTQASMARVWMHYITGFIWPFPMEIIPAVGIEKTLLNARTITAASGLLAVLCGMICLGKKSNGFLISMAWFFLFLMPSANIIPIKAFMSWRFVYISWFGLITGFGYLIKRTNLKAGKIFIAAWFFLLAGYSYNISSQFRNDLTLWQPLTIKHPELSKPWRVVAGYYIRQNKYPDAAKTYVQGLKNCPDDIYLLWNFARLKLVMEKYSEALDLLDKIKINFFPEEEKYEYLYDYIFACFNMNKYENIIKTINPNQISRTPSRILQLQAEALLVLPKPGLAELIHKELITRKEGFSAHS